MAYELIFVKGYFTDACCRWNQRPLSSKTWADLKSHFVEEHRTCQDTQPTSAGATYTPSNAIVEANSREAETIDVIAFLTLTTASDRDTYANLSRTVVSLMAELVLANKNLMEALNENTCL